MPRTIEQRMKALEEMIAEIHAHIVTGKPTTPGKAEFDRAMAAAINGNNGPMELYLQRGGQIPEVEGKPYKPYQPRKRVERPEGKSTNASGNQQGVNNRLEPASLLRSPASRIHLLPGPIMLPAKERGASSVSSTINL
ncbi:MAG: hypothetical protein Q8O19_03645 [Rectinemataceae bacterium]|nr:hypothetical protein [Rectinemataceae bacterium]